MCEGNDKRIVDAWRHKDTMHSVGKFLNWFRKLRLQGWTLESKAELASRGVESPDRADALIGAVIMGPGSDPYVLNPGARQAYLDMMREIASRSMENPWRVDRIQF